MTLRMIKQLLIGDPKPVAEVKPTMKICSKTVKTICMDQWKRMKNDSMDEFIKACQKAIDPAQVMLKEIKIQPGEYGAFLIHNDTSYIDLEPDLSFNISPQEALSICNQILAILRDPFMVISLLKDLDGELGMRMKQQGLECSSKDQPQYLLTGMAYYMPGPPPQDYQPKHKNKVLDQLLLEREMRAGINREGCAVKFVGIVEQSIAVKFVADGHLFTEEKQSPRMLMNGSHTHRIVFALLCEAIKVGHLKPRAGNHLLTPAQLLELLVRSNIRDTVRYRRVTTMWVVLMDNLCDELDNRYHSDKFKFLCRSPNTLNSILLCFGADLGVPHLQQCLLDSHWKAVYKMAARVQEGMSEDLLKTIPVSRIYTYCMEYMEIVADSPAHYDEAVPYAPSREAVRENSKYKEIIEGSGIMSVRRQN